MKEVKEGKVGGGGMKGAKSVKGFASWYIDGGQTCAAGVQVHEHHQVSSRAVCNCCIPHCHRGPCRGQTKTLTKQWGAVWLVLWLVLWLTLVDVAVAAETAIQY